MKKRILMISYYFAPQNAIGAVRPTKLAKYLTRMGYEVTVLCGTGMAAARDPMLERDLAELADVRVIREHSLLRWWKERGLAAEEQPTLTPRAVLPEKALTDEAMAQSAAQTENRNAATPAMPLPGKTSRSAFVRNRLFKPLANALYLWLCDRSDAAFARACTSALLQMDQHFDIVFSCYGPLSVHTVARRAKRFRMADRWIADFRDEATVHFPWQRAWLARYMHRLRGSADAITAVSRGFLQMMRLEKFGQVMANGYDPEDVAGLNPEKLGKQTLALVYCGQLYPGRSDLTPVFRAVRALIEEGVCEENRFWFHYAGAQGEAFAAQAAHFGLSSRVLNHGQLTRAASLALQQGADVLLAATWNSPERKGVVTGKLLEYLMADRPVICCVSGTLPNSEARALMEETAVGETYEESRAMEDAPRLRAYLRALYDARFEGKPSPYAPDQEAIAAYHYKHIAEAFAQLMENV